MMQWQPIETAPKDGKVWLVSDQGEVTKEGKSLPQHNSTKGYKKVTIGGKSVFVHRLVALAFIPKVDGCPEVNHKNGDKADNRKENLEWCNRSQNMKHAYAIGLHPGVVLRGQESPNWRRNGKLHCQSMRVLATFADGSTKEYESQNLTAADGFCPAKVSLCVNGKRRIHKGATWTRFPKPPHAAP